MGHFCQTRAKLREVPQRALYMIDNLTIFVIECIFDFFNSMCSFWETDGQSFGIGGRRRQCFSPGNTTNSNPICITNSSSKQGCIYPYSLQVSWSLAKVKLVKLTIQNCENRKTFVKITGVIAHKMVPPPLRPSINGHLSNDKRYAFIDWWTLGNSQASDIKDLVPDLPTRSITTASAFLLLVCTCVEFNYTTSKCTPTRPSGTATKVLHTTCTIFLSRVQQAVG